LSFKIALIAARFEERSHKRYHMVSFMAIILFAPPAHPMEYNFETLRRLLKMKSAKSKNAYMKKKDPLFVRESLLNAAFELAAAKGMADVTVNKVSGLANVTKGAFFHHFDSKETLVTELMRMLLARLDKQFDRLMAEEEKSDGCFTRAYIRAAFSEGAAEREIWGALLSLMASKDQVGRVWDNWLSQRLKRHSKTDSRIELRVVRLAADGVWLERIMNAKSKNLKDVEEYLIEMTRQCRFGRLSNC
jgi:AcrR family transcriptional regulator